MRIVHAVPISSGSHQELVEAIGQLARHQRSMGLHAELLLIERQEHVTANPSGRIETWNGVPVQRLPAIGLASLTRLSRTIAGMSAASIVQIHGNNSAATVLALVCRLFRKPVLHSNSLSPLSLIQETSQGTKATADIGVMSRTLVGIYQRMLGSPSRQLLNVSISTLSRGQAVSVIDRHLDVGERLNVGFVNAHSLNIATHNTPYREALEQFLVLNDGLGLNLASRIKYGKAFRDNLNGTDFVPYLLSTTRHRLRIYLVGTSDHAVQVAARKMSLRFPRHIIVGYRNGFFTGLDDIEATCRTISASKADCVLVGMGNPLQELWIAEHGAKTGARLLIGVGALLDFQAGVVSRAPDWIRRIHCEWIYRLLQEPRRLARRYLIGNAVFLGRAVRDARR